MTVAKGHIYSITGCKKRRPTVKEKKFLDSRIENLLPVYNDLRNKLILNAISGIVVICIIFVIYNIVYGKDEAVDISNIIIFVVAMGLCFFPFFNFGRRRKLNQWIDSKFYDVVFFECTKISYSIYGVKYFFITEFSEEVFCGNSIIGPIANKIGERGYLLFTPEGELVTSIICEKISE